MEYVVPKDLPLGLPAPGGLILGVLLVTFGLHIFFVNLMVGGSVVVFITELMGLKNPDWDRISRKIADTVTVNKSLAVVLGVGPLLAISVYYTVQFYTANTLTGHVWMMVVPFVAAAFLITYLHKYTWDALSEHKVLHISIGGLGMLIFLGIPFIFLANINLMLYPERWRDIVSFWDALTLPNVLPRYFHFIAASLALLGLFLVKYLGRESFFDKLGLQNMDVARLRRSFYAAVFGATTAQLVFGPLLFLTLPGHVISLTMATILILVIGVAITVLLMIWKEIRSPEPGKRYWHIVSLLTVIVALMIWARHDIRETAIAPHRVLVRAKTAQYMANVAAAQNYLVVPGGLGGAPVSPGLMKFTRSCGSCHTLDRRLVGPPLIETAGIYAGNPEGIVDWALNPGRKRTDYPPMAPVILPREDLLDIANYILEVTGNQ